jgi:hypothetical protein
MSSTRGRLVGARMSSPPTPRNRAERAHCAHGGPDRGDRNIAHNLSETKGARR